MISGDRSDKIFNWFVAWKTQSSELLASFLQQATNAAFCKTATEKGFQQSTLYGLWNLHFWKWS